MRSLGEFLAVFNCGLTCDFKEILVRSMNTERLESLKKNKIEIHCKIFCNPTKYPELKGFNSSVGEKHCEVLFKKFKKNLERDRAWSRLQKILNMNTEEEIYAKIATKL
ncbi:hypothetical protein BpHYR1_008222 [Brachionus plicatilis]|uniref:Uncharacterized protein n=1 Tax=Brachionus plicatilis TaxID=10195 RepID=A0A3M7T5V2_BRAPC|nr:hypothetical protein BpHYR1_008222 [Brachionus plicatilis]